jgi:type VI secretion system secreted protein VgrG
MSEPDLSDTFSRLVAPLEISQHQRLVQIETAFPSCTMVVERAAWKESTSGHTVDRDAQARPSLISLTAEVDCISSSAHLKLTEIIGEQVSLRLLCADGKYRPVHGYVTSAHQLGSDGGRSRYRIHLADFTHFLSLRRDTRIFLQSKADQIITKVLKAYPQANFRMEISAEALQAAPLRGVTTQYGETDADFVARLLSEEGWNWRLEHADDGQPLSSAQAAKHCLVISDPQAKRPDLGALRFGKPDVRRNGLAEDTITQVAFERRVQPNAVTLGAWHPGQLAGVTAQTQSSLDNGMLPTMEVYQGSGERLYAQHDPALNHGDDLPLALVADKRASLAMFRHELGMKVLHLHSAVRTVAVGAEFRLTEHSRSSGDNRFLVLAVTHEVANNLGSEAAELLQTTDVDQGSYRNTFTAVAAAATLVPAAIPKPWVPGVQTAVVVGHPNDMVTTERDLRVRIQFPWQRGRKPLSGGLDGPVTPGREDSGHAPGDAGASLWVRLAQPVAGANWGHVTLPRIGTEVLVTFVTGDVDRPLIVGQLHNGQDAQPWPAGVDSGANHPGTISGYHAPTLDQAGLNQWVLDDATSQVRMRLASFSPASPWSELSLGYIISQGMRSSQRGAWLGSGFYAHTQGWASIRADGLLISATARPATYGSAHSTQMDASEALSLLKGAQKLGQRLSEAAAPQGAVKLHSHKAEDEQALQSLCKAIDPKEQGKYEGAQGGQQAKKAEVRALKEPTERFAKPYLVVDTPNTAAFASPATHASFSGLDTSLTAQDDVHASAQHTASWVSGETTSLYNHEGDLKVYAANGNVSLRAHTDQMELLADKEIVVTSVNNEITVSAKDRIEMIGGDSKIVLTGGDIEYHTQAWVVQAAGHEWAGPGGSPASLPVLPVGGTVLEPHTIRLDHRYHDGEGISGAEYEMTFANGEKRVGKLDGSGRAVITDAPSAMATVVFGPSAAAYKPKNIVPNPDHEPRPSSGKLASLVDKYAAGLDEQGTAGSAA